MIKHETDIVKSDPSRNSLDKCFYCQEKVGAEHKLDCIMRDKTVVVKMSFSFVKTVPQHWEEDNIEFHLSESSYCLNNIINQKFKIFRTKYYS